MALDVASVLPDQSAFTKDKALELAADLLVLRKAIRSSIAHECRLSVVLAVIGCSARREKVIAELAEHLPARQGTHWSRPRSVLLRFGDAPDVRKADLVMLVNKALRRRANWRVRLFAALGFAPLV